ncbi:MAG: aldehyde dehydrogenase family protein, partial [Elusimicrobia bacterium]|nr:aldehyde dehydrogenase family protein [Elusimicrobiota bacterium]MBD3412488.1 aldehyde dehydrogenase family protein [Elusimicrobiota bacterium]
AERIAWGKFLNAGQTCVAPDTVYVQRSMADQFIKNMIHVIERFYGSQPANSPDYGAIINHTHVERLARYCTNVRIITGGTYNEQTRYFSPTLVTDIPDGHPLLAEEIFGPILPIIPFDDLEQIIASLQGKPKPLALYIFSQSRSRQHVILQSVPSGTACINDTVKQTASPYLPFGGIQESGMGRYHGKASFDCFTHFRSLYKTGFWGLRFHYPPYKTPISFIKRLFRLFT